MVRNEDYDNEVRLHSLAQRVQDWKLWQGDSGSHGTWTKFNTIWVWNIWKMGCAICKVITALECSHATAARVYEEYMNSG